MFGRHDIGNSGFGCTRGPFCHKAHYDGSHEFIAYDRKVRRYMRANKCNVIEAVNNVEAD